MQSLSDILLKDRPELKLNERQYILKMIYEVYDKDEIGRKKENWKRFIAFLKEKKQKNSPEAQKLFKKSKHYLRKLTPKQLAIMQSHIKTQDLYFQLSIAKDKLARRENVGSYLLGSIKVKTNY